MAGKQQSSQLPKVDYNTTLLTAKTQSSLAVLTMQPQTKEEMIAQIGLGIEEAKNQYPEETKNLSINMYIPAIDFRIACQERLDTETLQKLDDALGEDLLLGFKPETFAQVKKECFEILKGHNDLKEQFNQVFADDLFADADFIAKMNKTVSKNPNG
jgi:hypothetical protein